MRKDSFLGDGEAQDSKVFQMGIKGKERANQQSLH